MIRPPHKPRLDLHALQHPPLDPLILNIEPKERPVRRPELVTPQHPPHPRQLVRSEGNHVRYAPLERERVQTPRPRPGDPVPVHLPPPQPRRRRDDGVGDEQPAPEQRHQGTREVPAQLNSLDTGPRHDLRLRPRQQQPVRGRHRRPRRVLGGDVHGAGEGARPLHVGGVVVRVADDDGRQPAEGGNAGDGLLVKERDAVPEDVARRRAHEDGALADAELGPGHDGGEPRVRLVGDELVPVRRRHLLVGGERLPGGGHILPRIIADVAGRDNLPVRSWELGSASSAHYPCF